MRLGPGISMTRREHPAYTGINGTGRDHIVCRWNYLYTSAKGQISLLEYTEKHHRTFRWEIFGYGDFFPATERYATKEAAEERIRKLLMITEAPETNDGGFVRLCRVCNAITKTDGTGRCMNCCEAARKSLV